MEITPSSNEEPVYFANFGKKVPDRKGVFFWRPASILVSSKERWLRFLACYARRGNKVGRAASRGRRRDGEAARRRDAEMASTAAQSYLPSKIYVKLAQKFALKVYVKGLQLSLR